MKMKKAVSWVLSLMLVFTMIPALGAAAYAEDGGAPTIALGAGNIKKGNKVYMGVRKIDDSIVPISWLVLGGANSSDLKNSANAAVSSDNARLLITEKTQGEVQFDPDDQSNIWQGSNIQNWCSEFLTDVDGNNYSGWQDRFTALEESTALCTSKTDDEYNEWGTSELKNEKLFLLSAEEVSNEYGYFNGDESRIAYQHDKDETLGWWLRSPYRSGSYTAARVSPGGGVWYSSIISLFGARPAFNFDLTSVLFTSAAVGGKSSGACGADALSAISDTATNEWKLTLKDASRSGFNAAAATGATLEADKGYSEWSIPVVYSGAKTGNNEYVSVILCDSKGTAKYYGNIANNSAASADGGQVVNIPAGLTAGDYTMYVFSEQINGDKLTDYASEFNKIALTVKPAAVQTSQITTVDIGNIWTALDPVNVVPFTAEVHDEKDADGVNFTDKMEITNEAWISDSVIDMKGGSGIPKVGKTYRHSVELKAKGEWKFGDTFEFIYGGKKITSGYTADISSDHKTLTITGTESVTIKQIDIAKAAVTGISDKTYTGKTLTQNVTVKMDVNGTNFTLKSGTDYTVEYSNNTEVGTATVKITGAGNYTGSVSKTFKISEAATNPDNTNTSDDMEVDKKAADTAVSSITALKAADAMTLADKDAVTAVRASYDKLTDAQKKLVPADTLKKLTDAEAKIAALEKAKEESEKAAKTVVKGKTYIVSKMKYKVTNADMEGSGTVTLTGTTKKKTKLTKLTVPKTIKINGALFKVTAVGNKAFNKFTKIKKVTIGDNVKTIGTSAFAGNTKLTKVTIGKGVTKIGKSAFSGDKKLKTITIKSTKLKSVGKNAIKSIDKKAAIKVPKAKLKNYKKLFSSKTGFKKTMKVKK